MSFRFGAVILAAGYSSRMNSFKALLPMAGETVVERVLRTAAEAGAAERILVTGFERERLEPYIDKYPDVKEAYNDRFHEGMFSSIQAGAAKADRTLDGFLLMPVDCPAADGDILKKIAEAGSRNEGCFAVPCYMGKKGHPLFVPSSAIDEILSSPWKNGLKDVVDRYEDRLIRVETGSESVILDMDTEEEYREVLVYVEEGPGESFPWLARGRRFILVRHGEIRQHEEKIFLGITDVPLSSKGKAQAEDAAGRIQKLAPETDRIYSSPLSRAAETGRIIGSLCGIDEVIIAPGLREMSLGAWDGKPIEAVKRQYPEEYEKRGRHIFRYKFDHDSENFYDMQYRVIKEMKDILKKDGHRDVIVVAHKGVLRAIDNCLEGHYVDDPWEPMDVGEVRVIEK